MTTDAPAPRRRGRGEKFPGGRDAILAAARDQFAERGYAGATIRGIAQQAGVDPKLVMHFFSSKDELFAATLELPVEGLLALVAALQAPQDEVAERLTRAYVDIWESPLTGPQVRAMLLSVATIDAAAEALRTAFEQRIARALGDRFEPVAVVTAMSQLLGAALVRYVVRMPAFDALTREEFVAQLVPSVAASLERGRVDAPPPG
ncbi:TetR/AcrR family transcriptional regulator [Cellulomonas palmilytica]|uniref:TetR/AcrR family transcriptional regulator n=1 Tax=Cellulomonas palmilytica TaxID=2608402 RepID=UPI001F318D89|nr:TetR/AcrR family transcriptional regulator [Cellulomonas palmilytica]UJP40348.1 TetR family transcriptional regulator [Cellulomonas palmilytica]